VRNLGFTFYTGWQIPSDPRPCLGSLFEALKRSQDVQEGKRHNDFGHITIGLDARRSVQARLEQISSQEGKWVRNRGVAG